MRRTAANFLRLADEMDEEKPKKKRVVYWGHREGRKPKSVVVPYL
ncbi:MAG: hypothetical protein OXJ37_04765 [Bryobacterales bacterium]|nr:hypothetical protein [Bryobacterales bacterium]